MVSMIGCLGSGCSERDCVLVVRMVNMVWGLWRQWLVLRSQDFAVMNISFLLLWQGLWCYSNCDGKSCMMIIVAHR